MEINVEYWLFEKSNEDLKLSLGGIEEWVDQGLQQRISLGADGLTEILKDEFEMILIMIV